MADIPFNPRIRSVFRSSGTSVRRRQAPSSRVPYHPRPPRRPELQTLHTPSGPRWGHLLATALTGALLGLGAGLGVLLALPLLTTLAALLFSLAFGILFMVAGIEGERIESALFGLFMGGAICYMGIKNLVPAGFRWGLAASASAGPWVLVLALAVGLSGGLIYGFRSR